MLSKITHHDSQKVIHKDNTLEQDYKKYSALTDSQLFAQFNTSLNGIDNNSAAKILNEIGKNTVKNNKLTPWYTFLFKSFIDEFILVLILLATVSIFLKDTLGATIIYILAIISAIIRFVQDYSSYMASQKLKSMMHTNVDVRRNGQLTKIDIENIVIGDIVELGAGSLIPGDLRIIESRDLFISQSIFTGESGPVEKKVTENDISKGSTELENICLMGCNVISGSGIGVVIKTGKSTYLGHIAASITGDKDATNFEKGIKQVTNTLVRYMIIVVLGVFVINGFIKKDWLQAFMFSISVAVGITPGMLPMIINATLSKGAQFLAKKKTIVKNISSIQNLGAIDILCTDKTGTLTVDNVVLQRYMNVNGIDDIEILDYAFINSYYSTGIKNLIDRAIISYGTEHGIKEDINKYKKVDEIPFDYNRKRMSVVVEDENDNHRIITKGAIEEILKCCTYLKDGDKILPIHDEQFKKINEHADQLNNDGMHVIAICEKQQQSGEHIFNSSDESDMTFIGYVAFLDPPKPDVKDAINELYSAGIDIKVLTGDSPLVAKHICHRVGLRFDGMLLGTDVEKMSDDELKKAVEGSNIFARLAPMQKERVVSLLRENGHVVGYMGDGVNDAPSLRRADVGISVDSATDIAKESSDIILLEKSLMVLKDGVFEGRRIYGNIIKYMKMALSSNFGNVFSVLVASIFLPFLPMIPIQILIQNLVYDLSQIAIPWDNVDSEFLKSPQKWDTKGLSHFMNTLGITSSVFDAATFLALWFILGYNSINNQQYFQTGWFIEGLISQTIIIHFIRTSKIPFVQSTADKRLSFSTLGCICAALIIPILLSGVSGFNFAIMPMEYYIFLIGVILSYAVLVELVKKLYINRYGQWL